MAQMPAVRHTGRTKAGPETRNPNPETRNPKPETCGRCLLCVTVRSLETRDFLLHELERFPRDPLRPSHSPLACLLPSVSVCCTCCPTLLLLLPVFFQSPSAAPDDPAFASFCCTCFSSRSRPGLLSVSVCCTSRGAGPSSGELCPPRGLPSLVSPPRSLLAAIAGERCPREGVPSLK